MSPIPDEVIEQVRDAADIVGLIGAHVELKRTGADYRGPCPFHGGTHRNFAVIPKKGMFYCFVCHEAGDVFTFYMKKFGMDYPTAVRDVAAKVGISIPERPAGGPDPREPLYEALSVAAEWYARRLREAPDAADARAYLEGRELVLSELLPLGLGWAPKGEDLAAAMRQLGFTDERLLDAGLLTKREDGSLRPRFWQRLLFPIHDLRARVVGFGGRLLGDGEPKYLNSPDSAVFHKGHLLYNLHQAKQAIRQAEDAVVVEGYFDALRLVQVGIENVVAPLGTGLTPEQATLLRRFTEPVVLLYDGDAAGTRASFRAADVLLRAGLRVSVATLPPGDDPDTWARKGGADAVRKVLDDAVDVLERKLLLLERKGWFQSVAGRRRALDRLLPTLRAPRDPVMRDLYVGRVAEALGVTRSSIEGEMRLGRDPEPARPRGPAAPEPTVRRPTVGPERDLLRVMTREPEWRSRIAEQVADRAVLREPARQVFDALVAAGAAPAAEVLSGLTGEPQALLAELLAEPWGGLELDALVEGAVNRLDSRRLEAEVERIERELPFAAEAEKTELMRRVDTLARQIKKLNPARWNVMRTGRSGAR
ncbi:MAG: DNA primase [Gemmatimonadetes bacterium]|nr:DNA primase [Gemmatimonadota bacterium]